MKYVLSPDKVREAEKITINQVGISEITLVEKAAAKLMDSIENYYPEAKNFLILAGSGNNGADGLAVARMLIYRGFTVYVLLHEGRQSLQNELSLKSLKASAGYAAGNLFFVSDPAQNDCDLIIDALFGIGLNRPLSSTDVYLIDSVNMLNVPIISADIPSGLNAVTGMPMPTCIKSDITVTFGAYKPGLLLGKGPDLCKKIVFGDIELFFNHDICDYFILEETDFRENLPVIKNTAHKGLYGKTLIIAGSANVYGAAYLSAKAAFNAGAGMVKVITHNNNRYSFEQNLPEAMYGFYDSVLDYDISDVFDAINWADTIVIGPGMGTDINGTTLLHYMLSAASEYSDKTYIYDADALNIIAGNSEFFNRICEINRNGNHSIFTPHKKELDRLCKGLNIDSGNSFYEQYGIILVEKGAKTIIHGSLSFINNTGNEGMATAGSGDVLSGILGGLMYRLPNKNVDSLSVAICVYLHGLSGDLAAFEKGTISMTATDILEHIPLVWQSVIS